MQNSKTLFAERQALADKQAQLMTDDKVDEARIVEGQIKQLDITLEHILDEEDKLRNETHVPEPKSLTLGEQVLGSRDEFRGLTKGQKFENLVYLPTPIEPDYSVPADAPKLMPSVASTLPSVPGRGAIQYLQRMNPAPGDGFVGTWGGVEESTDTSQYDPMTNTYKTVMKSAIKNEVTYRWQEAVANPETIAGYVPISKPSLDDYDELMSVINNDLMIDLNDARDSAVVLGANPAGMIGLTNTVGIQQYDIAPGSGFASTGGMAADIDGGQAFEAIRHMRTMVMRQRRIPTHVAMHPDIKARIDLYKTNEGYYQFLSGNQLWGMEVVEDWNVFGVMVYDAYSAKLRPSRNATIEVGTINDQFIKNELCVLAEETTALQVMIPAAFCAWKCTVQD